MHELGQNLYSACRNVQFCKQAGQVKRYFNSGTFLFCFCKKPCIGSSTHKCEGDMCMLIFALGMYEYTYR